MAVAFLILVCTQATRASDILFVCHDRDVAIELVELANDYFIYVAEVGRVTMADRHGYGEQHRQVKERATRARASGDCAFVPAFDHRRVATLVRGPDSLAATGLARHLYEISATEGGQTSYLIAMDEMADQP